MSLIEKIKKNSTLKDTAILNKSKIYNNKDMISTDIPMFNVALSGKLDGGSTSGLTVWAGPSKHFKTGFCLLMASTYLKKYTDAVLLFYDSEFGTPIKYFETFDIDMERVIHTPITDIEELKFDIMNQIKDFERTDKVFIVVDSIGNLASKKEIEDALGEKSTVDMTRSKQIKSLFRMVTPHLTLKDIPMHVVNHTYKTLEMFSKDVVSGGTGPYYSADNIYILGRQQDKDNKEKELLGYDFIINVEKSRYVREKSKIPITISFDTGMQKYSGLLENAIEAGFVVKPTKGKYAKVDKSTGELGEEYKESETNNATFWNSILNDPEFATFIERKYSIAYGKILEEEVEE